MSELINTHDNCATIRWKLLTGVSALALAAYVSSADAVRAEDTGHPLLWIELSGQLSRLDNAQEPFSPAFLNTITKPSLLSALNVQNPPSYGLDEEGKISFQPEGSEWTFSAAIQYGRSKIARHHHQQTKNSVVPVNFTFYGYQFGPKYYYPSRFVKFSDGKAKQSERHLILDFQAGKDVGLGMFGSGSKSTLSAGVRFVQFNSKSDAHLSAIPDLQYPTAPIASLPGFFDFKYSEMRFHHYIGSSNIERNFRGVGPSLTWNSSVPFAGNSDSAEMTFDWGANAALLFGRQKARGNHQTTAKTYDLSGFNRHGTIAPHERAVYFGPPAEESLVNPAHESTVSHTVNRSRSIVAPNLGGFAGISLKWPNAKISIGYKADFFFNAIDGGIDTRKSENRGFYGPFASISVGLGD